MLKNSTLDIGGKIDDYIVWALKVLQKQVVLISNCVAVNDFVRKSRIRDIRAEDGAIRLISNLFTVDKICQAETPF